MAYRLPTFNLMCDIYSPVAFPGPLVVPRLSSECNLQFSRRVSPVAQFEVDYDFAGLAMWLLLPPGTDIRSWACWAPTWDIGDVVEVPQGSGRIYIVQGVDDVGKGFSNEFRCASIGVTPNFGAWPSPIP